MLLEGAFRRRRPSAFRSWWLSHTVRDIVSWDEPGISRVENINV
jgi:hypothetical protein